MAYLNPLVLDSGLAALADADAIHICSQEPATYAEATSTYTLGSSSSASVGAPADRSPSGREVTVAQITDGSVTGDGTATHWALVDTGESRLLAVFTLTSSQVVANGNAFNLSAFAIGIPAPA